jgi:hypothetical protein
MSSARADAMVWLEQRQPPPPHDLERRLHRALERTTSQAASVPELFADAAFEALASAARHGADRSAANDLLTADALLTYAMEAAAEAGADLLARVVGLLDVKRFEKELAAHERQ